MECQKMPNLGKSKCSKIRIPKRTIVDGFYYVDGVESGKVVNIREKLTMRVYEVLLNNGSTESIYEAKY